jgi:hypothetical protein
MVLKPSPRRHHLSWLFAAVVACGLGACKKKSEPAAAGGAPKAEAAQSEATPQADASASIAIPGRTPAQDAAPYFGFAARLPADTEAFFCTLSLSKHLNALKASNWAKDVDAFLNDKTPAPSAAKTDGSMPVPDIGAAIQQLWGHDFFMAMAKGGAKSLTTWQQFLAINSELQYFTLMQGSMAPGEEKKGKFEQMLALALEEPDLLKRAADIVARLELPPVVLGIQTDKPDDVIKQLVPAD